MAKSHVAKASTHKRKLKFGAKRSKLGKKMKRIVIVLTVAVVSILAALAQTSSSTGGGGGSSGGGSGPVVSTNKPTLFILSQLPKSIRDEQSIEIAWSSSGAPSNATVGIRLIVPGQSEWGYDIGGYLGNLPSGAYRFTARNLSEKKEYYQIEITLYERRRIEYDGGSYVSDVPVAKVTSHTIEFRLRGEKRFVSILSPKDGEEILTGQTAYFMWKSGNLPANADIRLNVHPLNPYLPVDGPAYLYERVSNTGGFAWNVPQDFVPGWYLFELSYVNEYGREGAPTSTVAFYVDRD